MGDPDLHRVEALGVVGAHRREDHEVSVRVGSANSEEGVDGDDGGPDVERGARLPRHPVRFEAQEFFQALEGQVGIHGRDAQALGRSVEPIDVGPRPEELDLALGIPIRLEPFEDRLAVMEHHGRRFHGDGCVRLDPRVVPAPVRVVIHIEHMVGEDGAEPEAGFVRLRLELCCARNCDLHWSS